MSEEKTEQFKQGELYVYTTNKFFLNFIDGLEIGKVKIQLASYDNSSGKQTGSGIAWLDTDEIRLIAHLVNTRQFESVLTKGYEKFGGSTKDGEVQSRVLRLVYDTVGGKFEAYPYQLTISNGPGVAGPTGAIKPKGEPTVKINMRLPESDLMKIMLRLMDAIHVYELRHNVYLKNTD